MTSEKKTNNEIDAIAAELVKPAFYQLHLENDLNLPSLPALTELMQRLRAAFFPGFHSPQYPESSARYHLAANLDSIRRILTEQIKNGFSLNASAQGTQDTSAEAASGQMLTTAPASQTANAAELSANSEAIAFKFIKALPRIRRLLEGDVKAAYEGDPAAKTPGETIFCYPSIQVITNHRVAHELYSLGVPLIPRIISEMAHAATGIDIHPGAQIGEEFFIDHGTGVVIGETCIIGSNCRLYQGVTLGALSFPKDQDGTLSKGLPRHPILENNVVVYSGATILGRVTIGQGSVIGGNVWITSDVPAGSRVIQQRSTNPAPNESMLGKK